MKFRDWVYREGGPKAIARHLGVTPHAVRAWLRGTNPPKVMTIKRLLIISKGALTVEDFLSIRTKRK